MDALKELDMKNWHLHDLLTYKTIQDRERDHNTLINAKTNEAWDKGRTEGEAIGMARGRTEGEAIGKYFTARNLLTKGIDVGTIAECTGLSIDEVRRLLS